MKKLLSAVTVLVLALLLVACGPKAPKKYQVTFDSDGGTAVPIKIVEDGDKVAKPNPDPTKADFTFKFWMEGTTEFDFNTAITKDTTLVAKWEAAGDNVPEEDKFKVTFDSGVAEQLVVKGQKATKPTNPTKEGFTFKHWALKGETTAFDFNTPVTKALELVAVWDENSTGGGEEQGQLIHNYDFTTLDAATGFVTEETAFDVVNSISSENASFIRKNAQISGNDSVHGVVLNIRKKTNSGDSPYLQTGKLSGISKVEFVVTNWNNDASFNLDEFATNVFIQTSTDGVNWNNDKDFKANWNKDSYAKNTLIVDFGETKDVYVRFFVKSAGIPTSDFNLRLVVESFKAWS